MGHVRLLTDYSPNRQSVRVASGSAEMISNCGAPPRQEEQESITKTNRSPRAMQGPKEKALVKKIPILSITLLT